MDTEENLDIEEALEAAGGWGRYQKILLFLSMIAAIPNAFTALHFVFSQYEPEHHCTYPVEFLERYNGSNPYELQTIISTIIPLEMNQHNEFVTSQCQMYRRNYSQYPDVQNWPEHFKESNDSVIVDCINGMTYAFTDDKKTATMEFSMVCDDDWKAPLGVSMYHIGVTIGSVLAVSADWYGRRPLFLIATVTQILTEVLCAFAWSFPFYCFSIVINGISGLTNYLIFFVLVTEVTDYRWRNFISISSTFGFSIGYCLLAPIAYQFPEWRFFVGVLAAIATFLYLPCCCLFPESPRWLAQKGRGDEAIKYLRLIATVNNRKKIFDEKLEVKGNCVISKNNITSSGIVETIQVLFSSGIAMRFFVVVYGWVVSSAVYFGISIYSSDFSDDRFMNIFLGGVAEFPAAFAGFLALKYIGRPRSMLLFMTLCGVSTIMLPFIPEGFTYVSITFAILGKASITAVFYGWYLIASEIVPTLQRSASMSICSATSRIGSIGIPYLMYLSKYNPVAPNMVMGIASILSGVLGIIFVPETLGITLPDTPEEARSNKRFYGLNILKSFASHKSPSRNRHSMDDADENMQML